MSKTHGPSHGSLYDDLTLELLRAERLTQFLTERLDSLAELDENDTFELHALSLIADHIRDFHARVHEKAEALYREQFKLKGAA